MRGDKNILTAQERQGYTLFKKYGCAACHQGANVGGNMFQQFGVVKPYYTDHTNKHREHQHARDNNDRTMFYKVPSLRVAVLTPPYFHDGSATSLKDAVRLMAKHQLGRTLTSDEIEAIVAFLHTLVGQYNGKDLL